MVQKENATRLPLREEFVGDMDDQEMVKPANEHHPLSDVASQANDDKNTNRNKNTNDDGDSRIRINEQTTTDEDGSNLQLEQENEQLRRQVEDLQAQMNVLRRHYLQHRKQNAATATTSSSSSTTTTPETPQRNGRASRSASAPGVVLELPRTMRTSNNNNNNHNHNNDGFMSTPLNCFKGSRQNQDRPPKDHQSFTADDDQSTVEPTPDWDLHESLGGLKHRGVSNHRLPLDAPHPPKRRSPDDTTRKSDPLTDGSFSSGDEGAGVNDDSDTRLDLESNDENGYMESESEARGLLPSTSTERANFHNNTNDNSMEEESFWRSVSDRAGWLVGLLVLQSMSSFILARNEALLQQHVVIVRFLTMLVGAGGNAGNQASVRVIRGLAVGSIDNDNLRQFLGREFTMGATLSLILGTAGCIRAAIFLTPWLETIAITTSLFMIVIISIVLGAVMPLGMKWLGIDPAHSSTTIQVVMDILGVTITVWMSALVLDSGFHNWLISSMTDA